VSSFAWPQYDVPGLLLLVQSPSHSAAHVYDAMDRFLADTLTQISEDQYLRHQQALINEILKPDENLAERAEFYWQSIAVREWGFDSDTKLAEAVEAVTFADWQAYYRRMFIEERLSLLALSPGSQGAVPEAGQVFESPKTMRATQQVYDIDLAPF
jgi:insulysin